MYITYDRGESRRGAQQGGENSKGLHGDRLRLLLKMPTDGVGRSEHVVKAHFFLLSVGAVVRSLR